MRITKSYNETPKGIQLEFDPELSNADLKQYLISVGFKNANRNKSVWYIRGVRPSYDRYASALENASKEGKDLLEVKIEPSYKAIRDNIDHKLFSLVTASIEFEDQEIKNKHYVVFEDFRVSAEDIANRFLTSLLGDKFKGLKVTAKNFKEKARNAFDEGRIITGVSESNDVRKKTVATRKESSVSPISKSLTNNEEGIYTKTTAGERYEEFPLPLPLPIEAIVVIVKNKEGKFVNGMELRISNEFINEEFMYFPMKTDNSFSTKKEALSAVLLNVFDDIKSVIRKLEKGNENVITPLYKGLEVLFNYASEKGIDLPTIEFQGSKEIIVQSETKQLSLTNEEGIYTPETAGDRYEIIEIPFSKKAKYKATIRLVKDENEKFRFAVDFSRNVGTHFSSQGGGISHQRHDQYNLKSEAIRDALMIFVDNIQEGLRESYKSTGELKETRQVLKIALKNIGDFAEKQSIFLITEQSKNIIKDLNNENLLIDFPELQSKKLDNDSLSTIVEQFIEKLADLEDLSEIKETEDLIIGTRLFLEEALTHSNEESFIRDLKEIINRLESAEEPLLLEPEHIKNDYIEGINKLARLLRVKSLVNLSTSLTNENGVYTPETEEDRYEVLSIPFTKNLKFEATIKLVQDEQNQYLYGLSVTNTLSGWSGYSFSPSKEDSAYWSREDALEAAILQVLDGVQYEHTEALRIGASEALKKAYKKTILAIYDFADSIEIKLPDEKSKAVLPLSIDEEESKKREKAEKKTDDSSELEIEEDDEGTTSIIGNTQKRSIEETTTKTTDSKRVTVQSIIDKLTDLEIDTEGVTETIIATFRLALEEALQIENEETFIDSVIQTIEDQKDWIDDIEPEAVRNTFLDLILSNAAALGYTPFIVPHSSGYILEQAWTKLDSKIVTDFEEFINSRPDLITHTYYPDESEPHGLVIASDRDRISFQIFENNRITVDSHIPFVENVGYIGSTMSMTKLKKAIRYILSNPDKVVIPEKNEEKTKTENQHPVTTDIKRYDKTIPNVLSPYRVIELFNSGLYVKDAKKVQQVAPYLLEASDDNLSELTAKELFELIQMAHPNDYGFAVTRSAMLREWEKRGQQIFEELGFPTDANYPYVNVNTGYRGVYRLQNIIGKYGKAQSWWSAAKNYRPIANLEKAIEIIEEEKADFKNQQLTHTNPKTGKPKSNKKDKELYRKINYKIEDLENSKKLIKSFLKTSKKKKSTQKSQDSKQIKNTSWEEFLYIDANEADRIRRKFKAQGFKVLFTGKEAFTRSLSVVELGLRWGYNQVKLDEKIEKEFNKWIEILSKEVEELEGKADKKSKQSKEFRIERIAALKQESKDLTALVEKEEKVFRDELFVEIGVRAKELGYVILDSDIANFRDYMIKNLFEGRIVENYPDEPIGKMVRILIDDFFVTNEKEEGQESWNPDYLDQVVAIMHDHYIKGERLSRKKIEAVKQEAGAPNLGVLWEAVELSWLLWYKQIYNLPIPFEQRLDQMTQFWDTVQPTYAYSDSSKELFKQYSTPCPIGAMVAEYTQMSDATRIFEPSAGNGLLVLGANPDKTHVNEIDKSRRYSLELQRFDTITHFNAAEPFPEELIQSFDVMVTNPPFASWDDSKFDKERWAQKYFNNQIDVAQHMRLEHFMAGLALYTLKNKGKAAIIIMGHVYFGSDGYIEKYKPFFNWLYRHYNVDDIINMNSYKLYNKQGAVTKTMLVLINGRKQTSEGVAPTKRENPLLEEIVNSFPELWERINSHIKRPGEYLLGVIISQLKIELGL
ncbi:Eco57I restriction-modification methylase domain-containing protein [Aquimarina megaterium]|uniref:Eco57I restriction-modification methylase domain-containing protein n=1 Tax=Aquimarina megaterium TaxID=1443666 RepID=UPI000470C99D|nr:SAM-dependent methyltransferase [Aquimarina megaterium]